MSTHTVLLPQDTGFRAARNGHYIFLAIFMQYIGCICIHSSRMDHWHKYHCTLTLVVLNLFWKTYTTRAVFLNTEMAQIFEMIPRGIQKFVLYLQWHLYKETREVLRKRHLPDEFFMKSCLFSLLWDTCLPGPLNYEIWWSFDAGFIVTK